ncbi:MAG: S1 RNA-binding domain-containing protein [Phycisphaerae bacterium]|nr:S1 RNA-binding domain-containing protein [Phycisphaerae bacterium]
MEPSPAGDPKRTPPAAGSPDVAPSPTPAPASSKPSPGAPGPDRDRGPREGGGRDRGPRRERGPDSRGEEGGNRAVTGAQVLDHVKREGSGLGAEIDAELDAAMGELSRAVGTDPNGPRSPGPRGALTNPAKPAIRGPRLVQSGREHRTGKVVSVGPSDIFIEFGPKELGVAPRTQWKDEELPVVGSELEVVVDKFEPNEGLFVCSKPGSVQKAEWELLEVGQTIEARVTGVVKGGLELEVAHHRAFMPASQVTLDRSKDLSVFIGEKFVCTISQVDKRGRGNIVLSRRDFLQAERKEKAEKLRATLAVGDSVEGVVRKVMPFGAFVDLGGVDGLIHISDLTYDRVHLGEKNVEKHVKEGDKVAVKVLKLDWEENRISLGLKQLKADPFQTAASELMEGAEAMGRVTKLLEFGAFVEVAPGVEGLVHISELAHRRVAAVGDVVKQDEIVKVKILKIDPQSRKVSLSIKALAEPPAAAGMGGGSGGGGGGGGRGGRGGAGGGGDRPRREKGIMRDLGGTAPRSLEEIKKESPALRRLREKFGKTGFKGGIA